MDYGLGVAVHRHSGSRYERQTGRDVEDRGPGLGREVGREEGGNRNRPDTVMHHLHSDITRKSKARKTTEGSHRVNGGKRKETLPHIK